MAKGEAQERYKAFISYSQKDSAEAGKVQSWLESFRLPKANAAPGRDGRRKLGRLELALLGRLFHSCLMSA